MGFRSASVLGLAESCGDGRLARPSGAKLRSDFGWSTRFSAARSSNLGSALQFAEKFRLSTSAPEEAAEKCSSRENIETQRLKPNPFSATYGMPEGRQGIP